ncbi:MAG: hypothetical protein M9955_12805 [Rhizobiaceae bacterium]|nr:hypothetical protein [Rhizobiaceae bacterium]
MMEEQWASELNRFRKKQIEEKYLWISVLIHQISMLARDTYEVGSIGVKDPEKLRRFNELVHRVATFQKEIASGKKDGIPDQAIFAMVEDELGKLGVRTDFLLGRLP